MDHDRHLAASRWHSPARALWARDIPGICWPTAVRDSGKKPNFAGKIPSDAPTFGDIRQGFVYERVPHITLKSIANNFEIDVIWEKSQEKLEPLRERLNVALGMAWEEWEIPRDAEEEWSDEATSLHARWWEGRIARQKEIDASISAKTDYEYLYDKPYQDKNKVRVAGPFHGREPLSPPCTRRG